MTLSLAARHKRAVLAELAEVRAEALAAARTPAPEASAAPLAADFGNPTAAADPAPRPATSPAMLHKQAVMARLAVEAGTSAAVAPDRPETGAEASEYALLRAQLGEHLRRLEDIQSTEAKIAAKRQMIDVYSPHVDATLAAAAEAGTAVQDEVLVYMMIWRFDIGDFPRGLDIAEHVLRYGLRLPDRFRRTPATIIAEEVAEAALAAAKLDGDFPLPVLQRAAQLTGDDDMPDEVRSKLEKALGLHFLRTALAADENPDSLAAGASRAARVAALEHLRRAVALNGQAGVKNEIKRLAAWLEKNAPADAADAPETDSADDDTTDET